MFADGVAADAHFVAAVDVQIGEELHVVVDVRFVALEGSTPYRCRAQQFPQFAHVLRVYQFQPQKGFLARVVAIKIEFLLKFGSEQQLSVLTSMRLGESSLQAEQKGQQLRRIREGLLERSGLDVE